MTPEEYQRLKEAEKEHLRSLRKLKQAVRDLERQKKLSDAVEKATVSPMDSLDRHNALVRDLAMETARNEARLDVALESISSDQVQQQAQSAEDEEAIRKAKAADLVRRLRSQALEPASGAQSPGAGAARSAGAGSKKSSSAESPEKKPGETAKPPLPEKTIGRMKS